MKRIDLYSRVYSGVWSGMEAQLNASQKACEITPRRTMRWDANFSQNADERKRLADDVLLFGSNDGNGPSNARLEEGFIRESKERFPSAILTDAHDDVRGYRQTISIEGVDQDDYFAWVIARGWTNSSFRLSIIKLDASRNDKFKNLVSLSKQQYPTAHDEDAG